MTNITDVARAGIELAGPEYNDFQVVVIKSGLSQFLGWVALAVIPLTAVIVILRHFVFSGCHKTGTFFFSISHIFFMIFLCKVVVEGYIVWSLYTCGFSPDYNFAVYRISQIQISLGAGLCIAVISTAAVAIVLRRMPKPDPWACFGMAAAAASIAIIAGSLLMISS